MKNISWLHLIFLNSIIAIILTRHTIKCNNEFHGIKVDKIRCKYPSHKMICVRKSNPSATYVHAVINEDILTYTTETTIGGYTIDKTKATICNVFCSISEAIHWLRNVNNGVDYSNPYGSHAGEISVSPGIYQENIIVNVPVVIKASNEEFPPVLNGGDSNCVINIEVSNVLISGLEFSGQNIHGVCIISDRHSSINIQDLKQSGIQSAKIIRGIVIIKNIFSGIIGSVIKAIGGNIAQNKLVIAEDWVITKNKFSTWFSNDVYGVKIMEMIATNVIISHNTITGVTEVLNNGGILVEYVYVLKVFKNTFKTLNREALVVSNIYNSNKLIYILLHYEKIARSLEIYDNNVSDVKIGFLLLYNEIKTPKTKPEKLICFTDINISIRNNLIESIEESIYINQQPYNCELDVINISKNIINGNIIFHTSGYSLLIDNKINTMEIVRKGGGKGGALLIKNNKIELLKLNSMCSEVTDFTSIAKNNDIIDLKIDEATNCSTSLIMNNIAKYSPEEYSDIFKSEFELTCNFWGETIPKSISEYVSLVSQRRFINFENASDHCITVDQFNENIAYNNSGSDPTDSHSISRNHIDSNVIYTLTNCTGLNNCTGNGECISNCTFSNCTYLCNCTYPWVGPKCNYTMPTFLDIGNDFSIWISLTMLFVIIGLFIFVLLTSPNDYGMVKGFINEKIE